MCKRFLPLVAACVALIFLLGGCGGGGSDNITQSSNPLPGAQLLIGGAIHGGLPFTRAMIDLGADKLAAGSKVEIYDFTTGKLIKQDTIGDDGYAHMDITAGLCVVAVITGTHTATGAKYRLSIIIPQVPNQDGQSFVANPATTLAAEALATQYYSKGYVDDAAVQQVTTAAGNYLQANPDKTVALGTANSLLKDAAFGAKDASGEPASINAPVLNSVITAVPADLDSDHIASKNAVNQIKQIGLPMNEVMAAEQPDVKDLANAVTTDFKAVDFSAIQQSYSALMDRLQVILLPLQKGVVVVGSLNGAGMVQSLPMGTAYDVSKIEHYVYLVARPNGVANQITIHAGTETVAITSVGGIVTMKETSTTDAKLAYTLSMSSAPVTSANLNASVSYSLTDSVFTTPLTFTGTITPNDAATPSATFIGHLVCPDLDMQGRVSATFVATVPAGASSDATIYQYPTSVAATGTIKLTGPDSASLTISGDLSVTTTIQAGEVYPSEITITNARLEGKTLASSLSLTSTRLYGKFVRVVDTANGNEENVWPTSIALNGANIAVTKIAGTATAPVTKSVTFTGDLSNTNEIITSSNGFKNLIPRTAALSGKYDNTTTKVHFEGSMNGSWTGTSEANANATLTIHGSMTRAGFQTYLVDMTVNMDNANGNVSCTVTNFSFGAFNLTGNASGKTVKNMYGDTNWSSWSVNLTNQAGVIFHYGMSASGKSGYIKSDVKKTGTLTQTATIISQNNMLIITFLKDNTTATLPLPSLGGGGSAVAPVQY